MKLSLATELKAHTGPINALQFDSTGEYVLTGGSDKTVQLHNVQEPRWVKSFIGHGWEVLTLALAGDSAKFASAGGDKSVYLWDVASAQIVKRFAGHSQRINTVAFNDDATVVASGSFDATVRLWDCKSNNRTPIQVFHEAKDSVSSVFICRHWILTGSVDGRIRTYDLRMGTLTTDVVAEPVTSAIFSGDNNCVLASSLDSCIRLFDVENGELLNRYTGHKNTQYRIDSALDPTDAWVASGSEDGKAYIWDLVDAQVAQTLDVAPRGPVQCVAWRPKGGAALATATSDGMLKLWTKTANTVN